MAVRRSPAAYSFGLETDVLATDSVVLREKDVALSIRATNDESHEGDIIYGLRYGLLLSTIIWAALIAAGFLVIR